MSNTKTIILPDADDMLQRLKSVSDEPHLIERFYPLILQHAGEQKVGMGVDMILQLAIVDYVKGMPPIMGAAMQMEVPRYLEALIDDEEVRSDALEAYNAARR